MTKTNLRTISLFSVLILIGACSGGGGGGGGFAIVEPITPPPTGGFQPGVFQSQATFQNFCAAPRSGPDPTNGGQPYPDLQGTTTDENNFLRSFTNNTYLWYDEIADLDPATFPNTLDYFDQLRTFENTATGTPRDQFSFAIDTEVWFNLSQGGVSAGYGVSFSIIAGTATTPRRIVVAFTEPNSPATMENITRGAEILSVDGVSADTNTNAGIATLNAGLFPGALGETHSFIIQDLGAGASRPVDLTSASITEAPVQNVQVIDTPTGRIGYLTYNSFTSPSEGDLIAAFSTLALDNNGVGVDDLVLDLRYNGGGFGFISAEVAYMIAGGPNTAGKIFDLIQFNDKHPVTNPITGTPLTADPFPTQTTGFFSEPAGIALPTLDLSRVFVLTGPGTCSASELVINGLRGADIQVIQIGSTTCGKPYGFFEEPNCGTSYFPIQFRSVNDKNFGDYSDGFVPSAVDDDMANVLGCEVADDFTEALGSAGENRLEVALAYQAGQGCTQPVSVNRASVDDSRPALNSVDGVVPRSPFTSNRVMLKR